MRSRLCRVCRDFHDIDQPWPHNCVGHFGAVANPAHAVRPDGMDPIRCHADDRIYDSRSAYYAAVERAGCHIVEPGSWSQPKQQTGPTMRESMKRAFHDLQSRR